MCSGRDAGATGGPGDPVPRRDDPPVVIPHSRPLVGDREVDALRRVVDSGMLAQGPRVAELERRIATLVGPAVDPVRDPGGGSASQPPVDRPPDPGEESRGVALNSGTAALYVALRCLDIGPGDEVLIPAYACMSLVQAVRFTGARPRFVDCRSGSWNADPEDARAKLTDRTRAVIVAHLFGLPAELASFRELGIPLIEDCAQTLGVDVGGRVVGSIGDMAVCSFYATKLIAGGEGGMLVCRDPDHAATARSLRDCESDRADRLAFNFKMSDLHAAVALTQLERLPEILRRRKTLARRYRAALGDLPIELPAWPDDRGHAWFRFVVGVGDLSLEELIARAEAGGLACRRPVGRLPDEVRRQPETLPGCRSAWQRALSIPLYPALDDAEVDAVLERIRAAVEGVR